MLFWWKVFQHPQVSWASPRTTRRKFSPRSTMDSRTLWSSSFFMCEVGVISVSEVYSLDPKSRGTFVAPESPPHPESVQATGTRHRRKLRRKLIAKTV